VASVHPAGKVGNAAFFLPPLSQLMSHSARELHAAVRSAATRHGMVVVNLYPGPCRTLSCRVRNCTGPMTCTPAILATASGACTLKFSGGLF